jgi:ATP-dependent DNA helicase RecG
LNAPTHRDYLNPGEILIRVELRDLLGLGDSPSASVEASHHLTKWSQDDGFLAGQAGATW